MTDSDIRQAILIAIRRLPANQRKAALAWLKARVDTYNQVARLG